MPYARATRATVWLDQEGVGNDGVVMHRSFLQWKLKGPPLGDGRAPGCVWLSSGEAEGPDNMLPSLVPLCSP